MTQGRAVIEQQARPHGKLKQVAQLVACKARLSSSLISFLPIIDVQPGGGLLMLSANHWGQMPIDIQALSREVIVQPGITGFCCQQINRNMAMDLRDNH